MSDQQQKTSKRVRNRDSVERLIKQIELSRAYLTGFTWDTTDNRIQKTRDILVAILVEASAMKERLS